MSDNLVEDRKAIVDYLRRELIGPCGGESEELAEDPSKRFSAGILYPRDSEIEDATEEEEQDVEGASSDSGRSDLNENQSDDPIVLANQFLPASMGISFYLMGNPGLLVRIRAARYQKTTEKQVADALGRKHTRSRKWQRKQLSEPSTSGWLEVSPGRHKVVDRKVLDGSARLNVIWRAAREGWLVTVTLINDGETQNRTAPDAESCLYQVGFRCRPMAEGYIPAYPQSIILSADEEERSLDILYRHRVSYGTGHGCSVDWDIPSDGRTSEIWTEVLPTTEVPPITYGISGYEKPLRLSFLAQGEKTDLRKWIAELDRFVQGYSDWVDGLPDANKDIPAKLHSTRDVLLQRMRNAAERMNKGVRLLESDEMVRQAFCLSNRAMLMQMMHSDAKLAGDRHAAKGNKYTKPKLDPKRQWRAFQLAFQLLVISSVANPADPDRDIVDLIWFPTGGGKTEAYLAVTAFLIFYRRFAHGPAGSGTAVLMRYTLRLLTTQQFRRAATLICACELIRREDAAHLGKEAISIGLWVGGGTTPNHYEDALKQFQELLEQDEPKSPFQMDWCPWCGTELVPAKSTNDFGSYGFKVTDSSFEIYCPNATCPFHEKLPVAVVDDQLYDFPPSLLLATVDKFARMPWEERVSVFFGGATRRPPDLIIQDELHLISGPLGTIVGVYEIAVDALSSWKGDRPKIIASTATIRRAEQQCQGLYARTVELFPPSGLNAADSYFARYDSTSPGRLYCGVLGPGHTASTTMIRTAAALLQAPMELRFEGPALDAWWTAVAYHNSLRELGKVLTFAADDIPARIKVIASDQARSRDLSKDNVAELTSHIDAAHLGGMLQRLSRTGDQDGEVSFLACTNMLSVGIDIQRLALMIVNGQPKSTSEYIQATSRVGRGQVPGLIVCVYSPFKPRDRSHYERFVTYHSSLYRQVEPTSVTPFAQPARERALHAVLVSLVRHKAGLPENLDAARFRPSLPELDRIIRFIQERVAKVDDREEASTIKQLGNLIAYWQETAEANDHLEYYSSHPSKPVLLRNIGDTHMEGWETLQSMRNVDRDCAIWVEGA